MWEAIFSGHVFRREKLEHLMTTGKIKGKHRSGKSVTKDVVWTNKIAGCKTSGKLIERED